MTTVELAAAVAAGGVVVGAGVFVGCTRTAINNLKESFDKYMFDDKGESKLTVLDGRMDSLDKKVGNGLSKEMKDLGDKLDDANKRMTDLEAVQKVCPFWKSPQQGENKR